MAYSNKKNNYIWIKLYCNSFCNKTKVHLIDASELKNMYNDGPLEGAKVFAYLFGLENNTPFKKNENNIEIEIDLTDFRVNYKTWIIFYGFLRNGFLSKSSMLYIEDVYEFVIGMGGVPSFESYYKQISNIPEIYNPMTPEEDIKCKYKWSIVSIPNSYSGSINRSLNPTDSITKKIGDGFPRFYVRSVL
jgi:hypothetical protein